MNLMELQSQVALGEDSQHQFNADVTNADSLAGRNGCFCECGRRQHFYWCR